MHFKVLQSRKLPNKEMPGFYFVMNYLDANRGPIEYEHWFSEECQVAKRQIAILYAALYTSQSKSRITLDNYPHIEEFQELQRQDIPVCSSCAENQASNPNAPACGILHLIDPCFRLIKNIHVKHRDKHGRWDVVRIVWTKPEIATVCDMIGRGKLRLGPKVVLHVSKSHSTTTDPIEFDIVSEFNHIEGQIDEPDSAHTVQDSEQKLEE